MGSHCSAVTLMLLKSGKRVTDRSDSTRALALQGREAVQR